MLGGEIALTLLRGLLEEVVDELVNDVLGDHCANGDGVVLEDVDQALLDEGPVDVVRLLQEQLDPSREVDLVLQEVLHDFLHKDVAQLEDLSDLQANGAVLSDVVVAEDLLEGLVEREDELDDELGNAGFHQYLLHLQDRTVAGCLDVLVVGGVDLADQQFEDGDEGHQQILVESQEHVLPTDFGVAFLPLQLGRDDLHHLHEGLLRGQHVGHVQNGLLRHSHDDETVLG
jgi:hypothetical protein